MTEKEIVFDNCWNCKFATKWVENGSDEVDCDFPDYKEEIHFDLVEKAIDIPKEPNNCPDFEKILEESI